jgi:hypothetical protein
MGEEAMAGFRFLARYRRSFEDILGRIEELDGPSVFRFDTSSSSESQIAEKVEAVLKDPRGR